MHTDAYASGIVFAFKVLSASKLLVLDDPEEGGIPIGPDWPAPGPGDDDPDRDPGFVRLCEIFVEVWELHRRKLLDDFLERLDE